MSDVAKLMTDAQQQLDEHKAWLKEKMHEHMNAQPSGEWKLDFRVLISQVDEIKLRMARIDSVDSTSILWEYPDALSAFLREKTTPQLLRASLNGGHVVDMEQPGFSVKRAP